MVELSESGQLTMATTAGGRREARAGGDGYAAVAVAAAAESLEQGQELARVSDLARATVGRGRT